MRRLMLAAALLGLAACGNGAANEFPASARAKFERSCPLSDPLCACTWERITRAMTAEEYASALERFSKEGLMDPRIAQARTTCLDRVR